MILKHKRLIIGLFIVLLMSFGLILNFSEFTNPEVRNNDDNIDNLINYQIIEQFSKLSEFSRILYKKANLLGFSQDISSQLLDAGVTKNQIKKFIDNFNKHISTELHIEEEVNSKYENTH